MPRNKINTKDHRFLVSLTESEYEKLSLNAAQEGISQAEFMRRLLAKLKP